MIINRSVSLVYKPEDTVPESLHIASITSRDNYNSEQLPAFLITYIGTAKTWCSIGMVLNWNDIKIKAAL